VGAKFRSSMVVPKSADANVSRRRATDTVPSSTRSARDSRTTWSQPGSRRPSACAASRGRRQSAPRRTNETTRTIAAVVKK
jgi:hypothetical protein